MAAPRFFRLAVRLSAYESVIAARQAALQEQNGGNVNAGQAKQVEGNRESVLSDPALAGVLSWGGG